MSSAPAQGDVEHPGSGLPAWIYLRETGAEGRPAGVALRLNPEALIQLRARTLEEIGALVMLASLLAHDPGKSWAAAIDEVARHERPLDAVAQRRVRTLLRRALRHFARRNAEAVA